jgi:hypothetical protein
VPTNFTGTNFLQFSDEAWKWIDNDIQPMSRLRIDDYKQIYADLGINIDAEDNREGRIDELRTIKLAEKYAQKPLAIVAVWRLSTDDAQGLYQQFGFLPLEKPENSMAFFK